MYDNYFYPYPVIKTKRLVLRLVRRNAANDIFEFCSLPETSKFAMWEPHQTIQDSKNYISWILAKRRKRKCYSFVIELQSEKKVIGTCSFVEVDENFRIAEIGYSVNKKYWENGYGFEAVRSLMMFGFDRIGFQRISAKVLPENTASKNLLIKAGFKLEGVLRKGFSYNGFCDDLEIYGITDADFFE